MEGGASLCCHIKVEKKNVLTRDHKLGLARVSSRRKLHPDAEASSWRSSMHHLLILLSDYRSLLSLLHWELNLISFLSRHPHAEVFRKAPHYHFSKCQDKFSFNISKLSQH